MVKSLFGEPTNTVSPTLGFSIRTLPFELSSDDDKTNCSNLSLVSKTYTLNIWDIGGQKTIRSYWRNYFESTDGIVWVVDSADQRRLAECKKELMSVLKQEVCLVYCLIIIIIIITITIIFLNPNHPYPQKRLAGASLLILANKQDIDSALTPDEIRNLLELETLVSSHSFKIVGCSALSLSSANSDELQNGLEPGIRWLVRDIAKRMYMFEL